MGRGEVKLKHKIIIGGFMKINKLSKIFALCLTGLMAFALIGCAQNSDDSKKTIPSGYEGGNGIDNGGGSGGGSSGSTSSTALTNTTWFYVKDGVDRASCTRSHYVAPSNPSGGSGSGSGYGSDPGYGSGSGSGSGYDTPVNTVVGTSEVDDSKNAYDELRRVYYLHVDSNNAAYFGLAEWRESYTETWKNKITIWSNGTQTKEEIDGTRKRNVTSSGKKTYTPLARGTATESGGKIVFDFPYSNTVIEANNTNNSGSNPTDDDNEWRPDTWNNIAFLNSDYDDPMPGSFEIDPTTGMPVGYDPYSGTNPYPGYNPNPGIDPSTGLPYGTDPESSGTPKESGTTTEKDTIPDMYLSVYVNNKDDALHKTHLIESLSTGSYASKTGANLRLDFYSYEHNCSDKAPDGSPCPTVLTDKYYTIWEPATYDEAMLTANPFDAKDSLKGKVFTSASAKDWASGQTYDYFGFYEKGSVRESDALDYWGSGIFSANKEIEGTQKYNHGAITTNDPWVVSEKNGKYYLRVKGNNYLYYFDDVAQGADPDFSKFYYKDYNGENVYWYNIEGAIYKDYLIWDTYAFAGNKYQYRKGYIKDKEWYTQAASWKDDKGNALICTGCSEDRKQGLGSQTYKLKLNNKEADVTNVGDCGNDIYGICYEGGAVSLTDKKDGTIVIKEDDKSYTLTYDSRFGYNAADFVEVDVTFEEEPETNPDYTTDGKTIQDYDNEGSKYNLPKTMKVSELMKFCLPQELKLYYTNNAYTSKGGSLVSADKTMEELTSPRSLYLIHEKAATAVSVILKYDPTNGYGYDFDIPEEFEYEYIPGDNIVQIRVTVDSSLTGGDVIKFIHSRFAGTPSSTIKITYGADSKNLGTDQSFKDAGIKDGDIISFVEQSIVD